MDLKARVYQLERELQAIPHLMNEQRDAIDKLRERFNNLSHIVAVMAQLTGVLIEHGPRITKAPEGQPGGVVPPNGGGFAPMQMPVGPGPKMGDASGHYF